MKLSIKVTTPSAGEIERAGEKAMITAIRDQLRGLRCPVHGQAPRVVGTLGKLSIEACCDELLQRATKALKG